jgi:hypothetical protein
MAVPMQNFRCGRSPYTPVRMDRHGNDRGFGENRTIAFNGLLKI